MKRRDFMEAVLAALGAGVVLGPAALTGCSGSGGNAANSSGQVAPGPTSTASPPPVPPPTSKPNILLVLMDEFRIPPAGYGPAQGEIAPIKEIFSFAQTISPNNAFTKYFQGLMRLRRNAVVLRKHYIASAACVPSRTAIMTGQYSTLTHVTSTDGTFKSGDQLEAAGLFLDPAGVPTIGDWFRAAGYDAKYFGKWHVSNEGSQQAPWDLNSWGFDCWEESGPEPHGAAVQNLGVFRDPGFALNATNFLTNQGSCQQTAGKPWFAVSSFVNPHDIGNWPMPFYLPGAGNGVIPPQVPLTLPQPIPAQGICADNPNVNPPVQNPQSVFPSECAPEPSVALNPDGLPQETFGLPPTYNEDLSTKPSCQFDFSYKFGLALKSMFVGTPLAPLYPLPLQDNGNLTIPWTLAYGQFYVYLHYLSDLQMRKVLQTLDATGLSQNTIVVFTSDHGEDAGAHGLMIQKWHSMYQESVNVPCVVSSPLVNPSADVMREVTVPTSHIDLAPTLLGLAGFSTAQVADIQKKISGQTPTAFVGTDLSPYIRGEKTTGPVIMPNGQPRFGSLFITDDEITAPIPGQSSTAFNNYLGLVAQERQKGVPLAPGPVRQPNHVRAVMDGTWKLARYFDPSAVEPDQWEMYYLPDDLNEVKNLVNFRTLAVRTDITVAGLTTAQIRAQRDLMLLALANQSSVMLKTATPVLGSTWTGRNSGTTQILRGVTFGNNLFVAVGAGGTIVTSPNGVTWTTRTSGTTQDLLGAGYGNGLYVAVGLSGTLLTSPDGVTWTPRTAGTTKNLVFVTFANGLFVIVGDSGTILTSTDGITWTPQTSNVTQNLEVAVYGNGQFAASGLAGTIVTSPDGATWTPQASGSTSDLFALTYGSGFFVAGGSKGTILTSTDGSPWLAQVSNSQVPFLGATYTGTQYVLVGAGGAIFTSSNGSAWQAQVSNTTQVLREVVYGNGTLVAVGDLGVIVTSP